MPDINLLPENQRGREKKELKNRPAKSESFKMHIPDSPVQRRSFFEKASGILFGSEEEKQIKRVLKLKKQAEKRKRKEEINLKQGALRQDFGKNKKKKEKEPSIKIISKKEVGTVSSYEKQIEKGVRTTPSTLPKFKPGITFFRSKQGLKEEEKKKDDSFHEKMPAPPVPPQLPVKPPSKPVEVRLTSVPRLEKEEPEKKEPSEREMHKKESLWQRIRQALFGSKEDQALKGSGQELIQRDSKKQESLIGAQLDKTEEKKDFSEDDYKEVKISAVPKKGKYTPFLETKKPLEKTESEVKNDSLPDPKIEFNVKIPQKILEKTSVPPVPPQLPVKPPSKPVEVRLTSVPRLEKEEPEKKEPSEREMHKKESLWQRIRQALFGSKEDRVLKSIKAPSALPQMNISDSNGLPKEDIPLIQGGKNTPKPKEEKSKAPGAETSSKEGGVERVVKPPFDINLIPEEFMRLPKREITTRVLIMVLVFVICVLLTSAVYFWGVIYEKDWDNKIQAMAAKVQEVDKKIKENIAEQKEFERIFEQAKLVDMLLEKHVYRSQIFEYLEKYTHQDVYVEKMTYTESSDKSGGFSAFNLDLKAKDLRAALRQYLVYAEIAEMVQEVEFDKISFKTDEDGITRVTFTLKIKVDDKIIYNPF